MSLKMVSEIFKPQRQSEADLSRLVERLMRAKGRLVGVVHALTIPQGLEERSLFEWNQTLARVYLANNISVLGGDTSKGSEFLVLITAIFEVVGT